MNLIKSKWNKSFSIKSLNKYKYNSCFFSSNFTFPQKSISNKNIFLMKKFKNFRNNELKANLRSCDIVFQTFWSDFLHLAMLNKNIEVNNFLPYEFDFTNFNDDSYVVFQNENSFINYECSAECQKNKVEIKEENCEERGRRLVNVFRNGDCINNSKNDLCLISRIPQEFNLDLKVDGNLQIVNTGDSKLIADKHIKIEYTDTNTKTYTDGNFNQSEVITNIFETKRLRTENFYFNSALRNICINIKSYLEAKKVMLISKGKSVIRIKKLGVVNDGRFDLIESDLDIRSIYGPVQEILEEHRNCNNSGNYFSINIENGGLSIGTIQGNVNINILKQSNVVIDNLECNNFKLDMIYGNSSRCELFINDIKSSCVLNLGDNKAIIYINKDKKENFKVIRNSESEPAPGAGAGVNKLSLTDNIKVIKINHSETNLPEIVEMTSWDYTKRKIESKLSKRKIDMTKNKLK